MQNFIDQAAKNGITLLDSGKCQLCGAETTGGIFECISLYSTGFDLIDFSKQENHLYKFLSVDAHALQHPEIHGRWNNHFHLTRLHLIFKCKYKWDYKKSPLLSNYLDGYKKVHNSEVLIPPEPMKRGAITTVDILTKTDNERDCKELIHQWALIVYNCWGVYHDTAGAIAKGFISR